MLRGANENLPALAMNALMGFSHKFPSHERVFSLLMVSYIVEFEHRFIAVIFGSSPQLKHFVSFNGPFNERQ